MSNKVNIFKNASASLLQKFLRMADQLLLVPFFLSAWGVSEYGEWLTLSAFPTILKLCNVGIGTASANSFVLKFISRDLKEAKEIYYVGWYLVTTVIVVSFILGIAAIGILNSFGIFDKLEIEKSVSLEILLFLMSAQLLNFYHPLLEARYLARRRASQTMMLTSFSMLLQILISLAILLNDGSMVDIAISNLVVVVISLLCQLYFSIDYCNELKNYKVGNISSVSIALFKKGLTYMLTPVWQALYFQGTTIVVRILLGNEAVAIFNTIRTLTRSINQLFSTINASIFPEIQFEYASGNIKGVRRIFIGAFALITVSSLFCVICLGAFGLFFYDLWTRGQLEVTLPVWWVMVIGILFSSQWFITDAIYKGTNEPKTMAVAGIFSSCFCLIVSWVSTYFYGMIGAALGMLIFEVSMVYFLLPKACEIINQPIIHLHSQGASQLRSVFLGFKKNLVNKF